MGGIFKLPLLFIDPTFVSIGNNFLSRTQLVAIDLLQDVSTRRSLSTAYRIRSEDTEIEGH